jgi:thiamine-phosphate pyrophosphorylase
MTLPFDLYLITDPALDVDLVSATRAVLEAVPRGRMAVQVRAKGSSTRELLALARALRIVTREHGALLLINERADLARLVGADGVQLPEQTLTPDEARAVLGEAALIGVSCHDARGLALAAEGRATFATLGPWGASPGKGAPLGEARFAELTRGAALPVLALGGVGPADVSGAAAAGARGVAVIRAIYAAPDPAAAARSLIRALDTAALGRR